MTAAQAGSSVEGRKIVLPDGRGKDLVSDACTHCHTLDRIVRQHMDAAGWKGKVEDMETRGLDLTPADEASIVAYLAAHYAKQIYGWLARQPPQNRGRRW